MRASWLSWNLKVPGSIPGWQTMFIGWCTLTTLAVDPRINRNEKKTKTKYKCNSETLQLLRWYQGMAQQQSTWCRQHNRLACSPVQIKASRCTARTTVDPNTSFIPSSHHVNQAPWTASYRNGLIANPPFQQTHTPIHHNHQQVEVSELEPNTCSDDSMSVRLTLYWCRSSALTLLAHLRHLTNSS